MARRLVLGTSLAFAVRHRRRRSYWAPLRLRCVAALAGPGSAPPLRLTSFFLQPFNLHNHQLASPSISPFLSPLLLPLLHAPPLVSAASACPLSSASLVGGGVRSCLFSSAPWFEQGSSAPLTASIVLFSLCLPALFLPAGGGSPPRCSLLPRRPGAFCTFPWFGQGSPSLISGC